MSLVSMKELLFVAENSDYAVGSFSVTNMEVVMGAIKAAEELNSPMILQIAEVRLPYSPLDYIGPLMVEAATTAKVPVPIHFDHGQDINLIKSAIDFGFTSVMFDGSKYPLEQNIKLTKSVKEYAHDRGIDVEGEIGRVGGSEDGSEDISMMITDVDEAVRFCKETGVDALAIAIGNAHGVYKQEPKLQFKRLREIDEQVNIPLVLHGGSGISQADFRKCIEFGIKKINVATSTLISVTQKLENLFRNTENVDYYRYQNEVVEAAYECVKEHILIFKSDNKA